MCYEGVRGRRRWWYILSRLEMSRSSSEELSPSFTRNLPVGLIVRLGGIQARRTVALVTSLRNVLIRGNTLQRST